MLAVTAVLRTAIMTEGLDIVRNAASSFGLGLAIATVLFAIDSSSAAPDQATEPARAVVQELVVIEAPNCIYCDVFRRDILPQYRRSRRADDLPIRFIDINDPSSDTLKLLETVALVPTAVVLRRGTEIGRISGYWGAEAFFKGLARMLGRDD